MAPVKCVTKGFKCTHCESVITSLICTGYHKPCNCGELEVKFSAPGVAMDISGEDYEIVDVPVNMDGEMKVVFSKDIQENGVWVTEKKSPEGTATIRF